MEKYENFVKENFPRFIEELKEIIKVPSISASSTHNKDMQRCAELILEKLKEAGIKEVKIIKTKKHPIIFGERIENDKLPTVLIYGHYDVQPVDPIDLWEAPPFEPTIKNNEIYGRGTADDKGQFFAHIKAIEAIEKIENKFPVNLKILIEGEEEIGSENLPDFLSNNKNLLKADYIIISDTPMLSKEHPSICYGLRGLAYFEIEILGPKSDLHSGTWGGAAPNPANILCEILSKLKNKNGKITIPDFYKKVIPLSKKERALLSELPIKEEDLLNNIGSPALTGEKGFTNLERIWCRPTLDINGLVSGYTGEGAKTVIPSKALAKISMRLVPEQDPEEIGNLLDDYLKKIAPEYVNVKIKKLHGALPYAMPIDSAALQAASKALEKGFKKKVVFIREGGSIPFVPTIYNILKKPCILVGLGLPDENSHAPNEKFDLDNFYNGILSFIYLYYELSKIKNNE